MIPEKKQKICMNKIYEAWFRQTNMKRHFQEEEKN
jgi:hypothetical protein